MSAWTQSWIEVTSEGEKYRVRFPPRPGIRPAVVVLLSRAEAEALVRIVVAKLAGQAAERPA